MKVIRHSILIACTLLCFGTLQARVELSTLNLIGQDFFVGVNCFAQAEDDFVWIGSNQGLYRYDGYQFFRIPGSENLRITALAKRAEVLWAGTVDGKLYILDGDSLTSTPTPLPETDDPITGIALTGSETWVAYASNGLHKRGAEPVWQQQFAGEATEIYGLCLFDDAGIAAGTLEGLYLIFPNGEVKVIQKPVLQDEIIRALHFTPGLGLWVGYDQNGFSLLPTALLSEPDIDLSMTHFYGSDWTSGAITTLTFVGLDKLYIGTEESGLMEATLSELGTAPSVGNLTQLSKGKVYSLHAGQNGKLYIATNRPDLLVFNPAYNRLAETLTDVQAISPVRDGTGSFWIARGSGVFHLDGNGEISPLAQLPAAIFVTCLYTEADGTLWLGSFDKGLFRFKEGYLENFTEASGLPNNSVLSITGHNEIVYVGTFNGIGKIEPARPNHVVPISSGNDGPAAANYIYDLHLDDKGKLWAGTDGHGLLTLEEGRLARVGAGSVLENTVVYTVERDEGGTIWMNTRELGLLAYRSGTLDSSLVNFSGQPIQAMSTDHNGDLVVISGGKFFRINKDSRSVSQFDLPSDMSTDSISSSKKWFADNPPPDLILSDIELGDGLSFELFNELDGNTPIIFVTAYDNYAIRAFEALSIDYVLKPIQKDRLAQAVEKFRRLRKEASEVSVNRVIIRMGKQLVALNLDEAAYYYSRNKVVVYYGRDEKRYPTDFNLEQLEKRLNPAKFFRINRQCIVNMDAIAQMHSFSKSRIKILLQPPFEEDTIVSKERYPRFKRWLKGE